MHPAAAAPSCEAAATSAEREFGVPPGLLVAIGRVEAGRNDPETGQRRIWPWTVNAQGRGTFFATMPEAAAFVAALSAQGVRSIDVGCFQVNLGWHPDAFASLADAFDPLQNARYATRFLSSLRGRGGDWFAAIGPYHSATQSLGLPYQSRVMAHWGTGDAGPRVVAMPAADPVVLRMTASAQAVRVFYGAVRMPGAVGPGTLR